MAGIGDGVARWARGSASGRAAVSRLGAGYIALCWRTTRWRVEGGAHLDALLERGGPFIAAFWHGRLFFSPMLAPPGRRTVAMISNNKDGELIAATVARFGVHAVRGSTADPRKGAKDKGGREAFEGGAAELARGAVLAITPDGPRGPRMRAQTGVAALSALTGAPVLPIALSTRRGLFARSWDRFLICFPFDRGVLIYGAPLPAPPSDAPEAVERHRRAVEDALNALTAEADRLSGRAPVTPDPAP